MAKVIKQDQERIKQHNKKMILNLVKWNRLISRAQLSKITKMSATSISRIVGELCTQGLLRETDLMSAGVGRQAMAMDINPKAAHSIGVEIDKNWINMAVIDFTGSIIALKHMDLKAFPFQIDETVDLVCSMIREFVASEQLHLDQLVGVGVGMPGAINPEKGMVVFSSQMGWKNMNFGELIQKKCGLKTVVDNNLKVIALAETQHGSARNSEKTVFISLGSGVGSVLVVGGEIYRGGSNSAGEIGHTTIDPNGILCECGRRGCLQTYIADWALLHEASKVSHMDKIEELFAAAGTEPWAQNILQRAASYSGMMISNAICMYNPDTIILTGELVDPHPEFLRAIKEQCEYFIWEPFKGTFNIRGSELKEHSIMIGAGILAIDTFLQIN